MARIHVLVLAPVGFDDQILPFVKEIRDRNHARLSRFAPDGLKQEDGLCAEPASNPPVREADEEGIEIHKPFDEGVCHRSLFFIS